MVYILTLRIKKLLENKIKINTIYNSLKNIKYIGIRASLVAWMVKHLPTMWETRVRSLGQEDPLEKEMATHSSIHAWKIPWTEEPGGLQSMGSQRVGHNWATSLLPPHFNYSWEMWFFGKQILISFRWLWGKLSLLL